MKLFRLRCWFGGESGGFVDLILNEGPGNGEIETTIVGFAMSPTFRCEGDRSSAADAYGNTKMISRTRFG